MDAFKQDRADLAEALNTVLSMIPGATHVGLQASDQSLSGFTLRDVARVDGGWMEESGNPDDAKLLEKAADAVWDLVTSLRWDGVVGEDNGGWAEFPITEKLNELQPNG